MNPRLVLFFAIGALIAACALNSPRGVEQHRWWSGLGPVLPHTSFPADCKLCHQGTGWNEFVIGFAFDHVGFAVQPSKMSCRNLAQPGMSKSDNRVPSS